VCNADGMRSIGGRKSLRTIRSKETCSRKPVRIKGGEKRCARKHLRISHSQGNYERRVHDIT